MKKSLATMDDAAPDIEPATTSMEDTRPWKIVTHFYPDTDAFACVWAAMRFLAKDAECTISFVRSGESLSVEEAEGYRVLHMDTGRGELDQHEKNLVRSSSFELFCRTYDLLEDPALQPIIELTKATDNVEQQSPTSIHHVLKGLAFHYKDPATKEVDWQAVCQFAFIALDIIYGQAKTKTEAAQQFEKNSRRYVLSNGIVITTVWWHPHLRDIAFERGADVVMWTQNVGRKSQRFNVAIQIGRKSNLTLEGIMAGIRIAEAKKRGLAITTAEYDFRQIGNNPLFGGWFLHDSLKLVACGTRSHVLNEEEFTQLSAIEILKILRDRLVLEDPKQ